MPEGPVERVVEIAVEAERLGYERCWIYDEGLAARDLYVTCAAIALATDRLEIGSGLTNPYTRHPGVTTAAIATLDELSDGRAFLGVGAGGSLTLAPLGLAWDRPLADVRNMVEVARDLFSTGRLAYGRPDIEIWVAGRGLKMLAMGAELADGVLLSWIHRDFVDAVVELIAAAPRRAYSTMIITDGDLDRARPHLTYRLADAPPHVKDALAISPDDVARLRAGLAEGGPTAAAQHVRDDWIAPFVITTEADLAALIGNHGIDEFLVPVLELDGAEEQLADAAALLSATR